MNMDLLNKDFCQNILFGMDQILYNIRRYQHLEQQQLDYLQLE